MENDLRILMLNYEYPPLGGGAGNATYYLIREFEKQKNLNIDLVVSSVGGFRREKVSERITLHFLDIGKRRNLHYQTNTELLKYSWKAYWYSRRLIKEARYDLCHAFFGVPCGYIAKNLKIPYIVSLRGSDVPFYNQRFKMLDKLIFRRLGAKIWRRARSVIANSEGLRNLALKTCPDQKISVIHNGIDTDEFRPLEARKENEKLVVISTGRLIQRKGYEYLIRALEGLDGIELRLIGEGNLKDELIDLAKELDVEVNFSGKKSHNEIPVCLQQADVFVLPSLNEGMSNSILEAMACGLPIITTDTGGSGELVKDNGFIVTRGAIDELTAAIEKYKIEKDLIRQHGSQSRKNSKNMNWGNVAAQYLEVYHKIA